MNNNINPQPNVNDIDTLSQNNNEAQTTETPKNENAQVVDSTDNQQTDASFTQTTDGENPAEGKDQNGNVSNSTMQNSGAAEYKEYEFTDNGKQQSTDLYNNFYKTGAVAGQNAVGDNFYQPKTFQNNPSQANFGAQNPNPQNNSYVKGNFYSPAPQVKKEKPAGKGFVVLMFCLSISLSLVIGAISGALVAGGINLPQKSISPKAIKHTPTTVISTPIKFPLRTISIIPTPIVRIAERIFSDFFMHTPCAI